MGFGASCSAMAYPVAAFGRRSRFGLDANVMSKANTLYKSGQPHQTARNVNPGTHRVGTPMKNRFGALRFAGSRGFGRKDSEFGKRRRVVAASRKKAMAAFRKFYKRYCKKSTGRRSRFGNQHMMKPLDAFGGTRKVPRGSKRRFGNSMDMMNKYSFGARTRGTRGSRFGEGGNPPLWQSMGYEFGSDGGVLVNGTGLFPTPVGGMGTASAPMMAPSSTGMGMGMGMGMDMGMTGGLGAFGKRRRHRRARSPVRRYRRRYHRRA